jgi:hypothetical protein
MKSSVYETKLQTVAELTSSILDAPAHIRNYGAMLCRATNSLLKRVRICLREGGGHFEQLL